MVKTRGRAVLAPMEDSELEEEAAEEEDDESQEEAENEDVEMADEESAQADAGGSETAPAESPESPATAGGQAWTGDPEGALPVDRAAKDFYQALFTDHEVASLKSPAGRSIKKYAAKCSKCDRRVTSTDSFYGFRAHFQTKHPDELAPAESETPKKRFRDPEAITATEMIPLDVCAGDSVDTLPWDSSGKEFFQKLFVNHLVGREQRKSDMRSGTRYSAECKVCAKKLTGLDGFFKFREHYKLRHSNGHVFEATVTEEGLEKALEDGETTVQSTPVARRVVSPSKRDKPAKEYFRAFFTAHASKKDDDGKPGCRRGSIRYSGQCTLCGKTIQGTDSYFGFRAHIKHKHKNSQIEPFTELAEFVTFPVPAVDEAEDAAAAVEANGPPNTAEETPASPTLTTAPTAARTADGSPRDKSAKGIYLGQFTGHESATVKAPSGKERKKVSAVCITCGKQISGLDSYHNFKTHAEFCPTRPTEASTSTTSIDEAVKALGHSTPRPVELQLHRQSIREFLDRSVEEPNPRSSRLVLAIAEYIKDSLKAPGTASASAPTSPAKLTGNLKRLQPISAKKQQQKSPIKRS